MTLARKFVIAGQVWLVLGVLVWIVCAVLWQSAEAHDPASLVAIPRWDEVVGTLVDPEYVAWVVGCTLGMALLQTVFLWPVRKPTRKDASGLSVFLSLAAAGVMIGALLLAAGLAAGQFLWNYAEDLRAFESIGRVVVIGTAVAGWLVGTWVLVAFCHRGTRESMVGRLAAKLLLGTIVETAAIIPLDVLVRRKESCYCLAGTYWALLICGAVGLVVLGPAILLPVLIRRRKRWYGNRCDACGFDLTGLVNPERCPECGAGWRPAGGEVRA
ncbi:MAG: hypothetical protein DYG92_04460 [Leptolyngbya sp. PLA1]|nr:hypothetical protein [Leptolyngbya sp. PLA1]